MSENVSGAGAVNVAVVGVGAVGELMLRVLAERKFPAKSIKVLARTPRAIQVDGRQYDVSATTPDAFNGVDIALFAGTEGEKGAAVTFGEEAVKRGAIVIDNGDDFRMRSDVPLVVPEVNGHELAHHHGIIANPNCSTAGLVMALKPIHDAARLTRVLVSTYQSVSGAGGGGATELIAQNKSVAEGGKPEPVKQFAVAIHGNIIPQIGRFDEKSYTSEEMKMVRETHKILGDSSIKITPMVAARVPVLVGHSESVYVETERPITPDQARALWAKFPNVQVIDDPSLSESDPARAWPTPVQCAGSDLTFVGRVRQDVGNPNGLLFWVVSDNLRKGAATNAVQIAEALIERGLVGKGT
jgi:aspartate-semialdehyde dehydrogenase